MLTERVAGGECVILFLRECSDEAKPFYTVLLFVFPDILYGLSLNPAVFAVKVFYTALGPA